jgi:ParB-like chromosome segregation protein Spo0J
MDRSSRLMSVGQIRPNPRNARTHSKRQIRKIEQSIRTFGFTNPLLVDEDGLLLAGHGRHAAAKLGGLKEVPVVQLSGLSVRKEAGPADR